GSSGGSGGSGSGGGISTTTIIVISTVIGIISLWVLYCAVSSCRKRRKLRIQQEKTPLFSPDVVAAGHPWTYTAAAAEPPAGSAYASYYNAPQHAYAAGEQYQKQHPPPTGNTASEQDVLAVQKEGHAAWKFEVDSYAAGIVLDETGFLVTFTQNKPGMDSVDRCCLSRCALTADPQNAERVFAYFEVTVQDILYGAKTPVISIGLATKPYPSFRLIGWNKFSVGYHSDDGRMFQNDGFGGKLFASPYTKNDTVGCGYDTIKGVVFFTLNGTFLGYAPSSEMHPYHAAVGADGPCQLRINVGQAPFVYQAANNGKMGATDAAPVQPPAEPVTLPPPTGTAPSYTPPHNCKGLRWCPPPRALLRVQACTHHPKARPVGHITHLNNRRMGNRLRNRQEGHTTHDKERIYSGDPERALEHNGRRFLEGKLPGLPHTFLIDTTKVKSDQEIDGRHEGPCAPKGGWYALVRDAAFIDYLSLLTDSEHVDLSATNGGEEGAVLHPIMFGNNLSQVQSEEQFNERAFRLATHSIVSTNLQIEIEDMTNTTPLREFEDQPNIYGIRPEDGAPDLHPYPYERNTKTGFVQAGKAITHGATTFKGRLEIFNELDFDGTVSDLSHTMLEYISMYHCCGHETLPAAFGPSALVRPMTRYGRHPGETVNEWEGVVSAGVLYIVRTPPGRTNRYRQQWGDTHPETEGFDGLSVDRFWLDAGVEIPIVSAFPRITGRCVRIVDVHIIDRVNAHSTFVRFNQKGKKKGHAAKVVGDETKN
ncbi:Rsp5p-dependent ubiquitination, sorting of cargo proteins at the multivesicular body, partial [Borealophlyctis nickersoniae]